MSNTRRKRSQIYVELHTRNSVHVQMVDDIHMTMENLWHTEQKGAGITVRGLLLLHN